MEPKAPGAMCHICTLKDQPFVPPCGSMSPDAIIVVGEAPGMDEVTEGKPFVGNSGQLLDTMVSMTGHNPDNLYRTNVVACRPPSNRTPFATEVQACSGRLERELAAHPAKIVFSLGKTASEYLITGYDSSNRGMWHTRRDKVVLPSWHPAYVLRKPGEASDLMRDVRVVHEGPQPARFIQPPDWVHITDAQRLQETLANVPEGVRVAFDIETDQVDWYDRPGKNADGILCLLLAWDDSFGIVIDDAMLYDTRGVLEILQNFFDRKDLIFCAQNAQFDIVFLKTHFMLDVRCDFDTMLAHYVLDENSRHGLKLLAKEEFGLHDYEEELIKQYLTSVNDRYSKIPFPKLAQYGVWDVVVTRALAEIYERRLKDEGLYEWPFMNIMMAALPLAVRMEIRGLTVDVDYIKQASTALGIELERVVSDARDVVGIPTLNLNSPVQLSKVIYGQLGLPQVQSYKIKPGSTAHDAIEPLKGKHPFIDLLLYHRRVAKIRSSYLENMIGYLDTVGRVHPRTLLYGTEVGRVAVRDPAAQTIPRPGKPGTPDYNPFTDGALVRGAIICAMGHDLLIVDYSQAELRVAACLSLEPYLLEAYRHDEDLHTKVALGMYGQNFTKEQRVRCKMFNFSYLYGGSEYSFATDAGLPIDVAKQFVRDYNRLMPRLAEYRREQYRKLLRDGYVQSVFGRRRRFTLITDSNRDEAQKSAMHAPVAGTASDLTLLSAIKADKDGIDVRLLVHDSILAEAPKLHSREHVDHIAEVMRETGETYLEDVPWKVDPEIRSRWAEPPRLSSLGLESTRQGLSIVH